MKKISLLSILLAFAAACNTYDEPVLKYSEDKTGAKSVDGVIIPSQVKNFNYEHRCLSRIIHDLPSKV